MAILDLLAKRLKASTSVQVLRTPFGTRKYDLQSSATEFADMKYGHDFLQPQQYVKDIWIMENLDVTLTIHYVDDLFRRAGVHRTEIDHLDYAGLPWKVWEIEGLLLESRSMRHLREFREKNAKRSRPK